MKSIKIITAAALSMLLISSVTTSVLAKDTPSEKEEVIYIMTDASGNVTDIEAVNIFYGGEIVDYGDYSAVKTLNTTDTITQSGDKITFTSNAEKVYYQGTMKSTAIPWNISIRYFLNGKEYNATDIAGKSGALEIHFTISKNNACKDSFYENYALQAAFTLDTDRCKNIKADGATVANVGKNKQLSYTILPGKGIDAVIKADVTDFEMDAVTINGVRLNLNIEIDDAKLMDKVDELVSAIDKIDSGASKVSSGTKTLSSATGTLNDKVGDLYSGVGSLTSGVGELYSGLSDTTSKNDQLTGSAYSAYQGLCNAAAAALNSQLIPQGLEPIVLTPETYSTVLQTLIDMGVDPDQQVSNLKGQLDSYGAFYQGLLDYTGAVSRVTTGTKTIKLNMETLYANTGTLRLSVGDLNNAVQELYGGTQELADGTDKLATKTSDMDTQISDEIASMTSSITGDGTATISFVSEQNTNVKSVQFVIKTAAIEKSEVATEIVTEETSLTFWQKLLSLFGLY